MPRSGAEARARLREAALQLYSQRGYDATTTAQIAKHAGVTERTYFRHFADKREVLFDGEVELRTVMTDAIAASPEATRPLPLVLRAYDVAIPLVIANRSIAVRRAQVIAVTPALQERAYAKSAALLDALTHSLAARGIAVPTARLAAQVGAALFDQATRAWDTNSDLALQDLLAAADDAVARLT